MQINYLRLLFIIIVVDGVSSQILNSTDGCPCSRALDCAPIYQVYPGHTACFAKNKTVVRSGLSADEKKEIVKQHNDIRSKAVPMPVNMLKMTWDDELAMLAQRFTDTCVYNAQNIMTHDPVRFIPGRFYVGQNLAFGYSSFEAAINAWYAEHNTYDPRFGTDTSAINERVGHYTQLVWASSNKVGCGFSQCDRKKYYVCNYAPGGNIFPFTQPYKTGATKCEDCLKCSDGLCDCGDMECANGGTLDPKTCKCSCQNAPVNIEPNCHVNCDAQDLPACGKEEAYLSARCASISAACPHMCKFCSCRQKTDKDGKCGSPPARTASVVLASSMLLAIFAIHGFLFVNF
ncbi:unnamed protein product [Candidula unifasciata]|uniref:SCP domain-containing protein n=1 Tax=Candidula unifasciata TaxID=100452 RepID=A0A8S3ZJS4_9EUPU|nr:unnamed protein product [Candidula unifasciata]